MRGGLPNDARMTRKPHHNQPRPYSERNQVLFLAGSVVVLVLALLALFLWWTSKPQFGP